MSKKETSKKTVLTPVSAEMLEAIRSFPKNPDGLIRCNKGGFIVVKGKVSKWFQETNARGVDASVILNILLHRCLKLLDLHLRKVPHDEIRELIKKEEFSLIAEFKDSKQHFMLLIDHENDNQICSWEHDAIKIVTLRESIACFCNRYLENDGFSGNAETFTSWLGMIHQALPEKGEKA